ncbi:MAG TPA: hypothetical protein PKA63_12265 [Oligoflexia bacterium]|nr:hypothetical protein [Oligoflexia bacterium]HMP49430.1 hypothetical protein [Oligoflexia bacterium]
MTNNYKKWMIGCGDSLIVFWSIHVVGFSLAWAQYFITGVRYFELGSSNDFLMNAQNFRLGFLCIALFCAPILMYEDSHRRFFQAFPTIAGSLSGALAFSILPFSKSNNFAFLALFLIACICLSLGTLTAAFRIASYLTLRKV